ncbi:MAG: class III signal peptide-containing protein [Candidatus Hydrothermarchaeales archaeon]
MGFVSQETGQVSIEFVILTGGVVVAAVAFFSLRGSIQAFANVTAEWVETERTLSISKLKR